MSNHYIVSGAYFFLFKKVVITKRWLSFPPSEAKNSMIPHEVQSFQTVGNTVTVITGNEGS